MLRVPLGSMFLGFVLATLALGQDVLPDQPPPSTAEPPDIKQAAPEPDAGEAPAETPLRQEHVIYLPFENLREALKDDDSSIVLPYAQFLKMWNRVIQPEAADAGPPVDAVITRADYVASVRGDLVRLEATLAVEVLGDEWARLPVQFGDAAIGSAESKDESVLLRGIGQGQYELLVRGQGKHEIKLSLMVGVTSSAEGRSFTVQCPAVGVSNLQLEIPEPELAVQVVPRRTSQRLAGPENATHMRVVLGATDRFTVSWQPQAGAIDQAAGLANVSSTISVDIGDGVVHTHAVLDYQILRGALDELLVDVPADQRLLDVQAPGLRDWATETVDDHQQVKVRLHASATQSTRLELHTETPLAEEAFSVGHIHAVGVARESGILAVRGSEDVALEFVERESLTRVDAADVPESLKRPRSTFYKYFTPDYRLAVLVAPLEPRVVVESRLAVLLDNTRMTARGEFQCHITRSGVFSLAFRLPPDFQVDDVRTEAMERFELEQDDNGQRLTVYFGKKLLGDVTIHVAASRTREQAAGEVVLPLPEPLDATREEGLVAVIAPESLEVKTDAAQLHGAWAAAPGELASRGFEPQAPDGSTLAATFAFVTRPVRIVQTIAERPRRTVAVVGTLANIKEDVVQVTTTLQYQIQFAGTNTFRLAVPAGVSDRLQIEGDGIKERRRGEPAAGGGMVEWTIILHSEVVGPVAFTATYDQTLSIADDGTSLTLTPIQILDADRETGEIAILKDRALSIEATPAGLEQIDPRELSQPFGTTQPYLAYRYYQHPAQLTLNVTKHEVQEVVKTVVDRAYIEAVVTREGSVTMRARYQLRSSERQRLAVTLRSPRILGITVAGQSAPPEIAPLAPDAGPDDKTYFLNVARPGDSDEPFHITIVFETDFLKGGLAVTDLLRLPLPQFAEGVKFQRMYVRTWVPREYRLVGDPESFTSHIGVGLWDSRAITRAQDNPDNWFPPETVSFDFQTDGMMYLFSSLTAAPELQVGYWHIPTMTLIASGCALAIGLVLLYFSLETKVFTLLALLLVILALNLFLPSLVGSWLLAARPGIAAVVLLWAVVWLLAMHRSGQLRQVFAGEPGASPAKAGVNATTPDNLTANSQPSSPAEAPAADPQSTEGGNDDK